MLDTQVERLIQLAEQGDLSSRKQLFTVLYDELHRLARSQLRRGALVTMSPTTLLHETYLKLAGPAPGAFPDRARFLAYASRAMRGLLIDYVRSRGALKRGGAFEITAFPTEQPLLLDTKGDDDLQSLGEALESLSAVEPRLAQLVDLKFFCGFSLAEVAGFLGISPRTAQRDWDKARILLQRHLREQDSSLTQKPPDGDTR